ncbi:DoxX family membrane protein [Streptomyces sp. A3M-1-3]|uniref:TQO small subunit DoxD n=1 Tax=Streptomyces sp. A3M-1-3 TaxID=2962044 RepID=UPI0020B651FD|nr:TQO small subunit DoxD [Streptomyces sp. A3M-1-3]MCP3818652.1 DoxX family membrane protein [Streptomyces sp. A3M-1-3]
MAVGSGTTPGPEPLAASRPSRVVLAVCRVAVGLLWIQNVSWKHPPRFGNKSDPPRDLYDWTLKGVENEVFAPWAWLVEHVILPHFAVFAWAAFAVEACLGAFLLVGLATRFWALVGLAQTTAITFSVLNTPHEWFWSYILMYVAHLALLATAAGRAYGVDGALRPVWRQQGGRFSRLLLRTS